MWVYPTVIGKVPPGHRTGKTAGFEFCRWSRWFRGQTCRLPGARPGRDRGAHTLPVSRSGRTIRALPDHVESRVRKGIAQKKSSNFFGTYSSGNPDRKPGNER